ncbi:MAG: hypothetical protein ACI4GD_00610 [Lachnospiraceae bacterium]
MKIKALTSFSGSLSMRQGEEREVSKERAKELVDANFAQYLEDVNEKLDANENTGSTEPDANENTGSTEPDENEEAEKIAPVQSRKSKKADKNAD